MRLIHNNPTDVVESLIWNTLIPSYHELQNDIDDSYDKENEEDDEHDDLLPVLLESEEAIRVDFQAFQFPCATT